MIHRAAAAVAGAALVAAALMTGTAAAPAHAPDRVDIRPYSTTEHVVAAGTFDKIYDPSVGETQPYYINDHTIIRAADGTWHLFGITHAEPADADGEISFAHATAPSLHGPWTKQANVLQVDPAYGETHVWAPHVIRSGGKYWMFYAGGGDDHTATEINVATSTDLFHWTRNPAGPLFRDGFEARDPMVVRIGGQWVMYYCATDEPSGGHHVVAYRTSRDLLHWSSRHIAYTSPDTGTGGGDTESPFVQYHDGRWYLFVGPCGAYAGGRNSYVCTDVFASRNPFRFSHDDHVGRIASHAAEVVQDTDGSWWVSDAGWGQGGVYLAPLSWNAPYRVKGVQVRARSYSATVQTSPVTQLVALRGRDGRNLVDTAFRGTEPYAGIGGFGDTDPPGAAARVGIDRRSGTVTLSGIPIGDEPVTVDQTLRFTPGWFDTSYAWHVRGTTSATAWEVGWDLDTTLPQVGDDQGLNRPTGDVHGFARWTMATDPGAGRDRGVSLVAAYKPGSAWSETNHFFLPDVGEIAWQPLWAPGGTAWPPGDYAGGTWRIGISPRGNDTAYANRLAQGLSG